MMFAIGMAILAFLFDQEREGGQKVSRRYATALMLMTSFAASIGGLATPIGTPPNVIGLGFIRQLTGVEFPFFKWCVIGVPVVVVLFLWLCLYLNWLSPAGVREIEGSREMLNRERDRRSEEHTSELQSRQYLVCRLLLEKKKHTHHALYIPTPSL